MYRNVFLNATQNTVSNMIYSTLSNRPTVIATSNNNDSPSIGRAFHEILKTSYLYIHKLNARILTERFIAIIHDKLTAFLSYGFYGYVMHPLALAMKCLVKMYKKLINRTRGKMACDL